jgi:hypothetical protein
MIEPPKWEALSFLNLLSSEEREDGIAKRKKRSNESRDESANSGDEPKTNNQKI